MGRYGEGEPNVHAAGVAFDGRVKKLIHLGKSDDFIEFRGNLSFTHSKRRAIEKDVFPARQFGVEAGSNFQKTGNTSADVYVAFRWIRDAGQNFQKRTLAGTIPSNDADDFARLNIEIDVLEGPEVRLLINLRLAGVGIKDAQRLLDLASNQFAERFRVVLLITDPILFR